MKNLYIRFDNRKFVTLWEKMLINFRKIFAKISIEKISIKNIEDTFIILIPKYKHYNLCIKNRLINQIKKVLETNRFENNIFCKETEFLLKEFENTNLSTGKKIMKNSVLGILDYIFNINKISTQLENVYVFMNQYSKANIKIVEYLCKNFKTVNIITENLKYFRKLENSLYNEGILVTVSNNKRKSVRNAKYVINVDFEKEKIQEYNLNMNAIIINLIEEKCLFEKFFSGIIINNFDISVDKDFRYYIEEIFGEIDIKIFLESLVLDKDCIETKNELLKYDVKITSLTGIRGKISELELSRVFNYK